MHNKTKKIRIVLTGGGTAGHVSPIFNVKTELETLSEQRKYKIDFLYIGSANSFESDYVPKQKIKFIGIQTGKLRRYFDWQNFIDPFKIIIGFIQSFFILLIHRPCVVFSKGGYVAVPVICASWILGIPIITHESDVIMGVANNFASKIAKKICVGFPSKYYRELPAEKLVYTGNPATIIRSENKARQNLKTLLIMGGSQGARAVNQIIAEILPELTKHYYVIHQAGKTDYEWLKQNHWENYELYGFTEKLPELISQADLIISRAGAGSLAQVSASAKPVILIPLPTSANNHQVGNAKVYQEANAAITISENKLSAKSLLDLINRLMEDKETRKLMSLATRNLYHPKAAVAIAKEIINMVE